MVWLVVCVRRGICMEQSRLICRCCRGCRCVVLLLLLVPWLVLVRHKGGQAGICCRARCGRWRRRHKRAW